MLCPVLLPRSSTRSCRSNLRLAGTMEGGDGGMSRSDMGPQEDATWTLITGNTKSLAVTMLTKAAIDAYACVPTCTLILPKFKIIWPWRGPDLQTLVFRASMAMATCNCACDTSYSLESLLWTLSRNYYSDRYRESRVSGVTVTARVRIRIYAATHELNKPCRTPCATKHICASMGPKWIQSLPLRSAQMDLFALAVVLTASCASGQHLLGLRSRSMLYLARSGFSPSRGLQNTIFSLELRAEILCRSDLQMCVFWCIRRLHT